jgi:hypothetical protein
MNYGLVFIVVVLLIYTFATLPVVIKADIAMQDCEMDLPRNQYCVITAIPFVETNNQ